MRKQIRNTAVGVLKRAGLAPMVKSLMGLNGAAGLNGSSAAKINFRGDHHCFDRYFKHHGTMKSTAALSDQDRMDACLFYQYREKSECALTAASSYYGGDYMEFGALDLNTFRNFLSAYDIFRLDEQYPDTRFYAFDIFGKMETANAETQAFVDKMESSLPYFSKFTLRGDLLPEHLEYVKQHGLYESRCHLVQGYFHDTLSKEFKERMLQEGRCIGFAFLDCNRPENYKIVFEWIYDLMGVNSYIYLDEYLQVPGVHEYFEEFTEKLKARDLSVTYIRNAAGFGALFRIWGNEIQEPLEIDTTAAAALACTRREEKQSELKRKLALREERRRAG